MNLRKIIPFLIVFLLSVVIRVLFYIYSPDPTLTADSYGYYSAGTEMIKTGIPVHHSRPPVYPILINLPLMMKNIFGSTSDSPEFFRSMNAVTLIQSIMGITGIALLYLILKELKIPRSMSLIFCLFMGLNIMMFVQERAILTESLSAFLLILLTWVLIKSLYNIRDSYFFILNSTLTLLVFLKPAYLLLPFITFPILILSHRKSKIILHLCLFSLFLIFILISVYVNLNRKFQGYDGFSRIGDINLLGIILTQNLNVESAKNISFYYSRMNEYRKLGGTPMPFRFLEFADPRIYVKAERFNELKNFTVPVIKTNLGKYISYIWTIMPKGIIQSNMLYFDNIYIKNNLLHGLFDTLFKLYAFANYANLIILPVFPVLVIVYLVKPSNKLLQILCIGFIPVYHLLVSVPFTYEYQDLGRLLSPTLPQFFLFDMMIISWIIKRIRFRWKPFNHLAI